MKSGSLNLLEPSGPLQACNGTALAFYKIVKQTDRGLAGGCKIVCLVGCVQLQYLVAESGQTRSCTKIQNSRCVLRAASDVFWNDPRTRRHVLR